jgi:uncharacterized damage-inducible protein DinB
MSERDRLIDLLQRTHDGDAWHGPSVMNALEGVTAQMAAARPIHGAHSIWEIALHIAGWRGEIRRRLEGAAAGLPPDGDWPSAPRRPTDAQWAAVLDGLRGSHAALVETVRTLDETRLDEPVKDERSGELGTGASHYVTLHGIVHHDLYHAGQIVLLKKAAVA